MSELKHINPAKISAPPGFSAAVQIVSGQPVYISGQIPFDQHGNLVGKGDFRKQTEQVFTNIGIILEELGIGFEQVVKFNYYVTNMSHLAVLREVRNRFIDANRPPASTLVEVRRLFHEDVMVEIEAVAVVPAANS